MLNVYLCYSHWVQGGYVHQGQWFIPYQPHYLTHNWWHSLTFYLYTTIRNFITIVTSTFWVVLYIPWPLRNFTCLECMLTILILNTCIFKYRIYYILLCMAELGLNKSESCLGVRCCKYMDAPQYTMLVFGFSSLHMLRWYNKKEYATLYVYDSLLQLYISIITIP